jgi:hypothetical protein
MPLCRAINVGLNRLHGLKQTVGQPVVSGSASAPINTTESKAGSTELTKGLSAGTSLF